MLYKDAVKARIKKLEWEMMGAMHSLQCLRAAATYNRQDTSRNFNHHAQNSGKLSIAFHRAEKLQATLERKIMNIRNEICGLNVFTPEYEFALAA